VGPLDPTEPAETRQEGLGAILLTGGASRRLGTDKATLALGGTTLAQRAAAVLHEITPLAVEVGPGVSGLPAVLEDPPGTGPLAAFAAGLHALGDRIAAAIVLAVDMPGVTAAVLRRLADHPAPPGAAVVPVSVTRYQPLCARYPATIAGGAADALLADGTRSMHALLDRLVIVEITDLDDSVFIDVDTPADLERVKRRA